MRATAASIGLLAALAAAAALASEATGRTPQPVVEKAESGTQCVAPPELMRRSHMDFLKHQRDDTVHGGIRGAKFSLRACIECHASQQTGSVNRAETNFCVSCHSYAAVKIDCFDCHTGKSGTAVARGAPK
jgi:[DsrC]-trisulfide reductase subunit J